MDKLILYIDGASLGNPGPAGIGAVLLTDTNKVVKKIYKHIGDATNNIAEYNALIYGLHEAIRLKAKRLTVNSDSELLVRQIKGEYKVKDNVLRLFYNISMDLFKIFDNFEIIQISREKNKEADRLAAKAIDTRIDLSLKEE